MCKGNLSVQPRRNHLIAVRARLVEDVPLIHAEPRFLMGDVLTRSRAYAVRQEECGFSPVERLRHGDVVAVCRIVNPVISCKIRLCVCISIARIQLRLARARDVERDAPAEVHPHRMPAYLQGFERPLDNVRRICRVADAHGRAVAPERHLIAAEEGAHPACIQRHKGQAVAAF